MLALSFVSRVECNKTETNFHPFTKEEKIFNIFVVQGIVPKAGAYNPDLSSTHSCFVKL